MTGAAESVPSARTGAASEPVPSAMAGPVDDRVPAAGEEVLTELREQARHLVAEVAGPLRRIYVRRGDAVLEVEWHGRAAPDPGGDGHPAGSEVASDPPTPGDSATGHRPRTVVSPMVGTFYRCPEPGAPPFVDVGDVVEPDRVIGIVEAMKLMNEIVAGQSGRVADLLAADGQPVEFGQPLITLAPV
ncbi:acetyl-CoA carboxylase biotin carboxyl carrier protein [Plantactinospora sp. GCM10030261]|uniref:acetyl-CoA carboxylase biotin carboxyl carrier protein n=1 Tax=Plantactinospora sp. GCM10030261 TaxID=3273420 RepID=UPI003607F07E